MLVGVSFELVQEATLLVVQVSRHEDVDEDPLVAAAVPLQHGHASAAEDDDLARLRPRLQLELLLPSSVGTVSVAPSAACVKVRSTVA